MALSEARHMWRGLCSVQPGAPDRFPSVVTLRARTFKQSGFPMTRKWRKQPAVS
jgi:hypothetical protein